MSTGTFKYEMPLKMPCCSRFIIKWRAFMTHRTNSTLSVCRNTRNGLFCAFIWFDSIQMLTDTIRAHMHRNKMPNQNGNQFSRRNYDYNQNNSMERQKNVRKTRKRIRPKKKQQPIASGHNNCERICCVLDFMKCAFEFCALVAVCATERRSM